MSQMTDRHTDERATACSERKREFTSAKMVLRKQAIKRHFIFPPHLTSASALLSKMKKDKNSILSFKCCTVALSDFNKTMA